MSMVIREMSGDIAVLTLNNPAQYNALAWELLRELNAALDGTITGGMGRAILLTGAGKGFCAGAQFGGDTFDQGDRIGAAMRDLVNPVIEKMRKSPIPIVTAINGPAAGAGFGIALAGDIVIAARSARFILSFVRLGAVLDGGTSVLLQRSIGVARARALALTGEPLSAEKAAEWGLVWKCVSDETLMDEAMTAARTLAAGPPIAIGSIKRQLEEAWVSDLPTALDREAIAQSGVFATDDLREGAAAFVEKRQPRFVGR